LQYPGWAEIPDAKKPGELVVHLVGVPVPAPYWIFKLGPETYGPDGLYEYAVVSSELQVSLFVLTRNVTKFYSTWKPEIDVYLKQNGWDKVTIVPQNASSLADAFHDALFFFSVVALE
jgi:lipocalin